MKRHPDEREHSAESTCPVGQIMDFWMREDILTMVELAVYHISVHRCSVGLRSGDWQHTSDRWPQHVIDLLSMSPCVLWMWSGLILQSSTPIRTHVHHRLNQIRGRNFVLTLLPKDNPCQEKLQCRLFFIYLLSLIHHLSVCVHTRMCGQLMRIATFKALGKASI